MITKHFRIFFFIYIPFSCYNVWSSSEHNHWYDDIRSSCQWAIGLKFPSCSIFLMFLFSPFSFLMQMLSQLKLSGLLNCFLAIHMYALFFFYSLALSLALSFTYNTIYQMLMVMYIYLETNEAMMMKIGIVQGEEGGKESREKFLHKSFFGGGRKK